MSGPSPILGRLQHSLHHGSRHPSSGQQQVNILQFLSTLLGMKTRNLKFVLRNRAGFSQSTEWNNWFCINRAPLFWRIMLLCCREGWQRVWWPEPCMYQSLSGSYWWKNSSSSLNLVKYLQPLSSWWLYARLSNIHHKLWLQHWWILVWNLLHFLASSWID